MKTNNSFIGASLIASIACSLCCITPVLVLIAGTSGMASAFSWIEPYRPYLIGFTILVIGFTWYLKLKPKMKIDCNCEAGCDCNSGCACESCKKPKFTQAKKFLGIVTLFAALMITFPYYSSVFYPKNEKQIIIVESANIRNINLQIEGMTCTACVETINYSINKLAGILKIKTSYETGTTEIDFDKSKTTRSEIVEAINSTGYKVINSKDE